MFLVCLACFMSIQLFSVCPNLFWSYWSCPSLVILFLARRILFFVSLIQFLVCLILLTFGSTSVLPCSSSVWSCQLFLRFCLSPTHWSSPFDPVLKCLILFLSVLSCFSSCGPVLIFLILFLVLIMPSSICLSLFVWSCSSSCVCLSCSFSIRLFLVFFCLSVPVLCLPDLVPRHSNAVSRRPTNVPHLSNPVSVC